MVTQPGRSLAAALAAWTFAVSAYAQEPGPPAPAPAPANLAFVEGTVDVVQDGVTERADPPVMLIDGDVVRTHAGRAEIVFGDGTLMHLSDESELEVLAAEHLRLIGGRAIVRLSHAAARPYVIDTPASSVRLDAEGEYSLATDRSGRLQVAVVRGSATLGTGSLWTLRGGQMVTFPSAGARPLIETFNSARWDAFERWAYERTTGFATAVSAAQLPYELRPYAPVFDHHGRWQHVAPHGSVWFPSVGTTWRPYHDGWWSFTRFGWTWRGRERWAWPTHHYGRWDFNGAFWFWIPATVWAPAWVSWTVSSGYIGWAPYGWHSRDRWRRDHPAYWPGFSPWRGWTVVHRDHFGPRRPVRSFAIDGDRLDPRTRQAFLDHATAVARTENVAVPRSSVIRPGLRGNVRRPPSEPAGTLTAPRIDQPARTQGPPSTASSPEPRRGVVRRIGPSSPDRRDAPTADGRGDATPPSRREPATRSAPQAGVRREPPQSATGNRPQGGTGGAVRRGATDQRRGGAASGGRNDRPGTARPGAVRAPSGSSRSAPPAAAAPSSQSRPAAQGGARRRPPGA